MFCNVVLLLKVVLSLTTLALGQQPFLFGQDNTRYIPDYQRQQAHFINPTANVIPFRQQPQGFQRDSYLPQRDLQTSDLPLHLQQTLPQYRFTTKAPPFNFESVVPSTHRPNYSYLFSQNHNHNPSQTETFLGEIQLQNPVDFTSKLNNFQTDTAYERKPEFGAKTKVNNENRVQLGARTNNFLNYRTRIFAPDTSGTNTQTQTKNYFVNENGEVFATSTTTKSPSISSELNETVKSQRTNQSVPFDLESLLEEPIKETENEKERNDDEVEVIKSKEQDGEEEEEYDDYELTTDPIEREENEVNNEEYEEEQVEDDVITPNPIETSTQNSSEYVVLTMKPSTMVKDDNFKEFVDTVVIDTSTEETPTTTDTIIEEEGGGVEGEEEKEPVVSVVTTKSVINNTVVSTAVPEVGEQRTVIPDVNNENSTDTWVVVASVQTSRSVSGAHYLPSSIVEQDERVKLLNEHEEATADEEETTTMTVLTKNKQKTSTESLIDKLDRVQSDLSSGLLTNGFKNDDNNIAVINETMSEKVTTTVTLTAPELTTTTTTTRSPLPPVNIRKFTPHKPTRHPILHSTTPKRIVTTTTTTTPEPASSRPQGDQPSKLNKLVFSEDLPSGFLPPGYKVENKTGSVVDKKTAKVIKVDDVSKFLPPGYKTYKTTTTTTTESSIDSILAKAKPVQDLSNLLPPGYKQRKLTTTEAPINVTKKNNVEGLLKNAEPVDISAFLPPGYKLRTTTSTTSTLPTVITTVTTSTVKPAGFKVVFPSRPGGASRKQQTRSSTTTVRSVEEVNKPTAPTIHKGWPSRATTEFTGWPTPSTTPISIEKLLEAARAVSVAVSTEEPSSTTRFVSTTTTTTTTTQRPTTPGVCKEECDLAGTIKLVGGAKWVPELLDRNTKEWQILANEVQTQLDEVFTKSTLFNKWYKKVRIDGFSKGSVLVDYLVELNELGRRINTMEIKNGFHDTLMVDLKGREGKSLNESAKVEGNLNLGSFIIDPKYTDFIVLPKQAPPTVGYAEDNVLLPQWAIAVIVIGLASLLFVIIFGVTVLVNRQKNAKKKTPTPLTEDMLHELNKNHMGGFDNFGANDLYSMEDVWNERSYDQKLPPKMQKSSGSLHGNSMSNLYDSWRSEWNGYYYNNYYGSNPGSSQSGKGRRRSDYDTNF